MLSVMTALMQREEFNTTETSGSDTDQRQHGPTDCSFSVVDHENDQVRFCLTGEFGKRSEADTVAVNECDPVWFEASESHRTANTESE